jgi:hypothetical protein
VRELAASYKPPDFAHVPDPDAAIFLCAVDHKTGYADAHELDGKGPLSGSELMWAVGLRAAGASPGLLTSRQLRYAAAGEVAEWFRIDSETVADPERRAWLWRDLASFLRCVYGGSAQQLLDQSDGRLGGDSGLVSRLRPTVAYSDPLAKKAFLFAKIAERRDWFAVADPENWEVSADNVLMRIALRAGLVANGPLDEVRAGTRSALKRLALTTDISPPVLDDMLWELGRDNPDLLGCDAGDLVEPARDPASVWY